jgi:hypothetical protein
MTNQGRDGGDIRSPPRVSLRFSRSSRVLPDLQLDWLAGDDASGHLQRTAGTLHGRAVRSGSDSCGPGARLLSIPEMWAPTIGAIESDPVLRGRYQFWVFGYPTGEPISLSALTLRESLARIYELYPNTRNAILVSHSLGGLLSQMQVVSTCRVLWDAVLRSSANRLYAKLPPDHLFKRALIFDANPRVERITFICVPHRGSILAVTLPGIIGASLIRLPVHFIKILRTVVVDSVKVALGRESYFFPPSVRGLSPRSTLLRALDTLPFQVPYHSIIGDRGRRDTPNSSDGVVAYWSSHLAGAQSELVVPGSRRCIRSSSDPLGIETHSPPAFENRRPFTSKKCFGGRAFHERGRENTHQRIAYGSRAGRCQSACTLRSFAPV